MSDINSRKNQLFSDRVFAVRPATPVGRLRLNLIRRIANHHFEQSRRVRALDLEELVPDVEQIRPCFWPPLFLKTDLGNPVLEELQVLSLVCAHLAPRVCFEFGTYDGLTTLHMALNSPPGSRIITLDLDPADTARSADSELFYTRKVVLGEHFHGKPEERKIEQLYGNSLEFDHRDLRGTVDLIFVDGGHSYQVVSSDSLKALDMLCPGGVILWHDYSYMHSGVYTCLNDLSSKVSLAQIKGTTLVWHRRTA